MRDKNYLKQSEYHSASDKSRSKRENFKSGRHFTSLPFHLLLENVLELVHQFRLEKSQNIPLITENLPEKDFSSLQLLEENIFFLITGHLAPAPGDESIVRILLRAREEENIYYIFRTSVWISILVFAH
ncbi:hypothetical protein AVEN_4504-1 [Araneus ventricosus]|uniref:Uncharacterized protein n=1 Tax=Araneus ventricosus TaxID=182803 RepID=A0A4Y2BKL0_ARAVE|nr:hypothetical protein AVEN_4504-1 [Araneus ventricosus]